MQIEINRVGTLKGKAMKKKLIIVLAAAMASAMLFTACGDKAKETGSASSETFALENEPKRYKAKNMLKATEYDVEDYVKLGDYKNISVEIDKTLEVTDENMTAVANETLAAYPNYTEVKEKAAEGYMVNIDYEGTVAGKKFDGGSTKGQEIVLGQAGFIDGFEDGLVGHGAGETVKLNLTFPADYQVTDLAGKDVVFTVKINKVSKPETVTYDKITDDYISEHFEASMGFATVKDFKDALKESMEAQRDQMIQSAYLEKLVEASEVTLPEGLLDERVQQTIEVNEESCAQYGMELEEYLSNLYGQTVEEFTAAVKEQTEAALKQELVLEELVRQLKTKYESKQFSEAVTYYAQNYGISVEEFIKQCGGKDYMILNYAEYNVALPKAAESAKVTYVDTTKETGDDGQDAEDPGKTDAE